VSEIIAVNIRYFLAAKGMSVQELALGSGHAPQFVEMALNDPRILRVGDLEAIAGKLGVQVIDLLAERDS
jgi:transcriptional regulator with XRE-family HTH domain